MRKKYQSSVKDWKWNAKVKSVVACFVHKTKPLLCMFFFRSWKFWWKRFKSNKAWSQVCTVLYSMEERRYWPGCKTGTCCPKMEKRTTYLWYKSQQCSNYTFHKLICDLVWNMKVKIWGNDRFFWIGSNIIWQKL